MARRALLEHFRWRGGHADVWAGVGDADALTAVVAGLVAPWAERGSQARAARALVEASGATFLGMTLAPG